MTYRSDKTIVTKYKGYLEILLNNQTEFQIRFKSSHVANPNTLAHNIRAAISASQHYEEYRGFADLKDRYRIRVVGIYVICELRNSIDSDISNQAQKIASSVSPVIVAERLNKVSYKEINTLLGMAGCIVSNPNIQEFNFPEASLSPDDQVRLIKLAESKGYKVTLNQDKGIEVIKNGTN